MAAAGCRESVAQARRAAAEAPGRRGALPRLPEAEDAEYRIREFWSVPGRGRAGRDFRNAVSVKDVGQAVAKNDAPVEDMKLCTTQGMAGRSGHAALVRTVDHLRGVTSVCAMVAPVGADPDNAGMCGCACRETPPRTRGSAFAGAAGDAWAGKSGARGGLPGTGPRPVSAREQALLDWVPPDPSLVEHAALADCLEARAVVAA